MHSFARNSLPAVQRNSGLKGGTHRVGSSYRAIHCSGGRGDETGKPFRDWFW